MQVATSHRPSAETSTPMIGSPRAGRAVWFQLRTLTVSHLCVFAQLIEQAYVAFVTSDSYFPRFRRSGCREVVFGCILLELALYDFVAGHPGVDAEESIMRCSSATTSSNETYNAQ